jgi:hypothetical protein
MSHLPTVAVDGGTGLRSWNNRRLERPDPPRLSHDGPGLATTPAARGAMTEVILAKRLHRLAAVPGVVIGTATPVQYPPAAVPASPDRGSHRAPRRQAPSPAPATARQLTLGNVARIRADLTWPTETRLPGWACKTRTPKCRGKLSRLSSNFPILHRSKIGTGHRNTNRSSHCAEAPRPT